MPSSRAPRATQPLQLTPTSDGGPLSPAQARFNDLTGEAVRLQQELRRWESAVAEFRLAYGARLEPLQRELRTTLREWLFALDAAAAQGKWSKLQLAVFDDLIREVARPLLELYGSDAELRVLLLRHGGEVAGTDGADWPVSAPASAEELVERLDQRLEDASEARERARAQRQADRKHRREQAELRSMQSVREVYRKVASALHPDREPDPVERAAKTRMMQEANRANEEGDLLTLLQLQLRLQQVEPARAGPRDEARLAQFNKALERQLAAMGVALTQAASEFLGEFGVELPARPAPTAARLERVIRALAEGLQAELADLRGRIRDLSDTDATRRMLKAERERRRHASDDDPGA